MTWPDVVATGRPLLAVPLGSCEQHGPHLPLDTDTRIADEVAHRLATVRSDVVVAPTLAFGASGEHQGFAGTLSIGTDALCSVLVELARSADRFEGLIWVCGHGGNRAAVDRATETLDREGRRTLSFFCGVAGGDAHAGRTETSTLLAVSPERVRTDRFEAGAVGPWSEIRDAVMADGIAAVSPNGVLGDPRGAAAAEGGDVLEQMVARLDTLVTAWVDERP